MIEVLEDQVNVVDWLTSVVKANFKIDAEQIISKYEELKKNYKLLVKETTFKLTKL